MNERGRPRHAGNGTQYWSGHSPDHGAGYGGFTDPSAGWPQTGTAQTGTGWSQNGWARSSPPAQGATHGAIGAADWESTDWFTPVGAAQATAVGVLDRPEPQQFGGSPARDHAAGGYPAQDHPSFPPGSLSITPNDVYEALGQEAAEDMLATADINVDELIRLINEETTVLPPLAIPDTVEEAEFDGAQYPPPELVEAISTWKQRFLKGAIAAVIVSLTGSGGAAAAMDKSVKLDVDGHETTVNTYDSTVGDVLKDEGIQVGPHDAMSPSPQAHVGHGDSIKIDRGHLLKMTVDGEHREQWVRSSTVGQALNQMGIDDNGAFVSADRNQPISGKEMQLTVNTAKSVQLVDGGNPRQVQTTAPTVGDLLKDQKVNVGPQDSVSPSMTEKLTTGSSVTVNRNGSSVVNVTQPVASPEQEIVDPTMFKGEEQVVTQGNPGEKIVFMRVAQRNGKETDRSPVGEKVTKQPTPTVKRVGAKEPPDSQVWDKLVQCEGGGDWATDSGNGYYGGLQFDKKTWDANGGSQYAPYPNQASREQQITVATKIRDGRGGGYGAWPSCSKKLGLES